MLNPMPNKPNVSYGLFPEKPALNAFSVESIVKPGPLSEIRTTPSPFVTSFIEGRSIRIQGLFILTP